MKTKADPRIGEFDPPKIKGAKGKSENSGDMFWICFFQKKKSFFLTILHNSGIINHNAYIILHYAELFMIKVLKKTFDIIEFISRHGGQPVLPAEIVREVKLNQATSIRILKDLVALGYLEQISRQKGYVLGPMTFWIAGGKKYRDALCRKADPFVLTCAKASGQSVLLAVNLGARRFILSHHNVNPHFNVDVDEPWYEDMYTTATGRLLMAHMPEKEFESLIKTCGLPASAEWPGITTANKLKAQLKSIKDSGHVAFRKGTLFIVSYPVFRGHEFAAALGMSVPQPDCDTKGADFYIDCLRKTAKEITSEISLITSVG